MGLFNKKDNERFEQIKNSYSRIVDMDVFDEEVIGEIDALMTLCNSIPEKDAKVFKKSLMKEAERDKFMRSYYTHPVIGFFDERDDIVERIKALANNKKQKALKAIQRKNECDDIIEVCPNINKEYELEPQSLKDLPPIKISNITKSFDIETTLPTFVVIDLETTGLRPNKDAIIQVCALRYEYQEPTEAFVSLVNPGRPIPSDASNVNNIYDEDVKDAPTMSEVTEDLLSFIGTSPLLGYNISFDLQFLFCAGIDLIKKRKIYDAKTLAKKLYKSDIEYYSLENVLEYNGITIGGLHDAKVDCYATASVFLEMVKEITDTY